MEKKNEIRVYFPDGTSYTEEDAYQLADSVIMEDIHSEFDFENGTPQEFFDEYLKRHYNKYGTKYSIL